MREAWLDMEKGKDLLKSNPFRGLIPLFSRKITARIPHQSAARTSLADSFSPGEAKALPRQCIKQRYKLKFESRRNSAALGLFDGEGKAQVGVCRIQ